MLSDSDTFGSSPQDLDEHNAEGRDCPAAACVVSGLLNVPVAV